MKDYVSEAKSSNVRRVITFLYLLKFMPAFSTQIYIVKFIISHIVWDCFRPVLESMWNFCTSRPDKTNSYFLCTIDYHTAKSSVLNWKCRGVRIWYVVRSRKVDWFRPVGRFSEILTYSRVTGSFPTPTSVKDESAPHLTHMTHRVLGAAVPSNKRCTMYFLRQGVPNIEG